MRLTANNSMQKKRSMNRKTKVETIQNKAQIGQDWKNEQRISGPWNQIKQSSKCAIGISGKNWNWSKPIWVQSLPQETKEPRLTQNNKIQSKRIIQHFCFACLYFSFEKGITNVRWFLFSWFCLCPSDWHLIIRHGHSFSVLFLKLNWPATPC